LFIDYFSKLHESDREVIQNTLKSNTKKATEYFMDNGYPINQETYTKFKEKFQIKETN
jgi:hypothetical protein